MTTLVDIVRGFYDALGRGDVPAAISLLDAQVEWTEAECFPYYSGTWHGPQAVLDNLLVPLSADWDGFSASVHEFIAAGDRVASLGSYSGTFKKTGRSFSAAFAHVWTVRGDNSLRSLFEAFLTTRAPSALQRRLSNFVRGLVGAASRMRIHAKAIR